MKYIKTILKVFTFCILVSIFIHVVAKVFDLGQTFINISAFITGFFFIPKVLKLYDKKIDNNPNNNSNK